MRDSRLNYILVGGFVLAMVAALVVSIALLNGRTGSSDEYFTSFTDTTGLKFGSKVFYMGYAVGQVEEIKPVLKDGRVRFEVSMSISRDFSNWQVPADSIAQIKASGLLAAITIDIRAGQSPKSLKPGDWIQGEEKTDVLNAVAKTADTVKRITVTSLKPLIENLSRFSGHLADRGPEIIDNFLRTSTQIRKASERLSLVLTEQNSGKVGTVLDRVLQASEELAQLTQRANSRFDALISPELIRKVHETVGNVRGASTDLQGFSHSARLGIERALSPENLQRVDNALANLEQASANIRTLAGPGQVKSVQATVSKLDAAAGELKALAKDSRRQLSTLLGSRTAQRVDTTLDNISAASRSIARLSADMKQRVAGILTPDVAARIRRALENFGAAAAGIARLTTGLESSRGQLDDLLTRLNNTARENRAPLRDAVRSLSYSLGIVAEHIDAVSQNLEGTSRNMAEFSRLIKQNPGLLLRSPTPPKDGSITTTGADQGG